MQSLLHMCVSPDSHDPVLFHLHLHLSETYFQLLPDSRQVASVFYRVVIPMLNPLIYSFRNEEVKKAVRNVITKKMVPLFLGLLLRFS